MPEQTEREKLMAREALSHFLTDPVLSEKGVPVKAILNLRERVDKNEGNEEDDDGDRM